MKMKKIVVLSAVLVAGVVFAQTAKPKGKPVQGDSMLVQMGGRHVRPGSQKGKIAVIDTQSRVPADEFKNTIAMLVKETKLNIVYEQANKADTETLKAASKADIAIVIVDDAKTPALLAAPEDCWAVMNVAKMDKNLKTDAAKKKFYVSRCGKELTRAFALVCGGMSSQYPGNVMNYARQQDVDLVTNGLPVDQREAYIRYLSAIDVTPAKEVFYEVACQEGWAPKPKDKYQQEIWDDVHALPEKPIKIKYDPKKGK